MSPRRYRSHRRARSSGSSGRRDDAGYALVTVLVALALLTTIGVGLTTVGRIELRTSTNHRSAAQALALADAGATHALALMRGPLATYEYSELLLGPDGQPDTEDDGQLRGYGLPASDVIPDTGFVTEEGRYYVELANDDTDPTADPFDDSNDRLVAICRGETVDGGQAEIGVAYTAPPFPAVVSAGDMEIPGSPDVVGPCAGLHANRIVKGEGGPVVNGSVTASDTVLLEGSITDSDGNPVIPESGVPPIEVPEFDPMSYCDEAEFALRDGWVVTLGPDPDSAFAGSGTKVKGWEWDAATNKYTLNGKQGEPGTVCATGNVRIEGNTGSTSDPLDISILSSGSVEVAGTPIIEADHSEDILIMARGDVKVSGNATGSTPNFQGMVYGGSQCMVDGTPQITGFLVCGDEPDPAGAINLTDNNIIKGDARITHDCSGVRRLTFIASWWENRAQ